jgi:glycerol uptake facilitator-like aquaporin
MKTLQALAAEGFGTAFLLAVVVGSGIMGERLSGGNEAIALLANSLATGCGLAALILTLAPVSGAHFNPLVSLVMSVRGDLPWLMLPGYVVVQMLGAIAGVAAAHGMFDLPLLELSAKARPGLNLAWSEFVATSGLLAVILIGSRRRPDALPYAVAMFITAAYWFTASTSFANPAVTLARAFTDSFAGIAITDVPLFLAGQGAAALVAMLALRGGPTVGSGAVSRV